MRRGIVFWAGLLALGACSSPPAPANDGGLDDVAAAADAAPPIEAGPAVRATGGSGGMTGATTQHLMFGGVDHVFAVHVPPTYDPSTPFGLLVHFHGWRPAPSGIAEEIAYVWGPTADANQFIAVAPEGQPCPQLDPGYAPYLCFEESRDTPFVDALVALLGTLYNVDQNRTYLSGHSGGSFFVEGYGIAHGTQYAAAVEFSGGCISASNAYGNSCVVYDRLSIAATRKLPMFLVHNPNDMVVPPQYSQDLLDLLMVDGHPTMAILDQAYDGGSTGHSIDATLVPGVWAWMSQFNLGVAP